MLGDQFEQKGNFVVKCSNDADVTIALTAVEQARVSAVCVVGEDTDLLVHLLNHADPASSIFFASGKCLSGKMKAKVYDINQLKTCLGAMVCKAMLGCDTTSIIHTVGKGVALKKV